MLVIENIAALQQRVGEELGVSDWVTIDQERINRFAEATGDHQWIHVDVERAERESPLGGPVAHGFLTLSLLPPLVNDVFRVEGLKSRVNYGLNKVRFMAPVTPGSRVRAQITLASVEPRDDNRYMVATTITIELEGSDKPACIAERLALYLF